MRSISSAKLRPPLIVPPFDCNNMQMHSSLFVSRGLWRSIKSVNLVVFFSLFLLLIVQNFQVAIDLGLICSTAIGLRPDLKQTYCLSERTISHNLV